MQLRNVIARAKGKSRRLLSEHFSRRTVPITFPRAVISFTFDDAPRTAFDAGRRILAEHGARATYFVSLGLLDTDTEVGKIGSVADFELALETGNELGCHTFDHLDAWHVSPATYVASVERNRAALSRLLPGAHFKSFAYPKSGPTLAVKTALAKTFQGCRGGGQIGNEGLVDLNLVKACFLDRRTGIDIDTVRMLVDDVVEKGGWLVFATHDIAADPSPFGCTPDFLNEVASHARRAGAHFRPFGEACALLAESARDIARDDRIANGHSTPL